MWRKAIRALSGESKTTHSEKPKNTLELLDGQVVVGSIQPKDPKEKGYVILSINVRGQQVALIGVNVAESQYTDIVTSIPMEQPDPGKYHMES